MRELKQIAAQISEAVVRELERAEEIAEHEFYTEAGLRIGRAVEASLYRIGSELEIDLTNRTVPLLEVVRASLWDVGLNIIRRKMLDAVRELSRVAKQLADAIAQLAADQSLWEGVIGETPRPNEQLLRELIAKVDDEDIKRNLLSNKGVLRIIQERRNDAAHADLNGLPREFHREDYIDLIKQVKPLIESLRDLVVGIRAKKEFAPPP